jgi:hypothetical protein
MNHGIEGKKFLESNNSENITYQHIWDKAKALVR